MLLEKLLNGINVKEVKGTIDKDVKSVKFNSLDVTEGDMFVAVKGTVADGHNYIAKAVESGATVVVCEYNRFVLPETITVVYVENSAEALGKIASNFYGNPSSVLKVVGVTGTNGKTTVATLLYDLFENHDISADCFLLWRTRYTVKFFLLPILPLILWQYSIL